MNYESDESVGLNNMPAGLYSEFSDNYINFDDRNQLTIEYDNGFMDSIGLGFRSVNWFEKGRREILIKTFYSMEGIGESGRSIAEAYQMIAYDLGAVTTGLGYSQAMQSQLGLKNRLMTKNIGNIYSLADAEVKRFMELQNERFETFLQLIKAVFIGLVVKYFETKRQTRETHIKSQDAAKGNGNQTQELASSTDMQAIGIHNLLEFGENLFRAGFGAYKEQDISEKEQEMSKNYRKTELDDLRMDPLWKLFFMRLLLRHNTTNSIRCNYSIEVLSKSIF